MGAKKYDFRGYAAKYGVRCSDGTVMKKNAFADQDGERIPLVWSHQHTTPESVIGHAMLRNRSDGLYAECSLNNTKRGKTAKEIIKHGDINSLSIYANNLVRNGNDILHGVVREVSLVLAGADPTAKIEFPILQHSDGEYIDFDEIDECIIHSGLKFEVDEEDDDNDEIEESDEEDDDNDEIEESDEEDNNMKKDIDNTVQHEEKSPKEIFDEMTEEQQEAVYAILGAVMDDDDDDDDDDDEDDENEEDRDMKHNVFENDHDEEDVISHDAINQIIMDAKDSGSTSLKKSFIAHAEGDYGITNIEYLFPDARAITDTPDFIKREDEWVSIVLNGAKHTPFSRVKTVHADITADEARARGYIKGNKKVEEVFELLRRTTDPQTIYKKQKLDRDDIIDITDFNVIVWLKQEMRIMLDEEIARAVLVGDGRSAASQDKIKEDHVRPIATDDDLYAVKVDVDLSSASTAEEKAKATIKAIIKARKEYKGSGTPTFFTTEDLLTDMLLIEDGVGRTIYEDVSKLATKLRVDKIVPVPVMEGLTRTSGSDTMDLLGVIVNMKDYNIGADKGGEINFFDDFDIDYNQEKYLIETRISGALVKPKSALVIETKATGG